MGDRRALGRAAGRISLSAGLAAATLSGHPTAGHAQEATPADAAPAAPADGATQRLPGDTGLALPGIVRLGLPLPGSSPVAVAATAGYGFYEAAGNLTGPSHQLATRLAASYSPIDYFSVGLDVQGRMQVTPGEPAGTDSSLYGEPNLTLRGQYPLLAGIHPALERLHFGADLGIAFIGEQAPSVDFAATTPTIRMLSAYQLGADTWLGLSLGYRFDNSAAALERPELLRVGDRFMLDASSFDAFTWQLGATHRLGSTEILAELSGDVLLGDGAPDFSDSPLDLTIGARHPLGPAWEIRGALDLSASSRPEPFPRETLMPFHPRFAISVGLGYRFGVEGATSTATAAAPLIEPAAGEPAPASEGPRLVDVEGQVVDEGGRPQTDVVVKLEDADGEVRQTRSFADGSYSFEDVPEGRYVLVTETPGYDPTRQELEVGEDMPEVEMVIYPAVPAGEIHGKVLDMAGNPVDAQVSVTSAGGGGKVDREIQLDAQGAFEVELPPGRYTVRFSHPDYRDQVRTVELEEQGVLVLNIALQR